MRPWYTLNQALTCGFDAAGIELDHRDFEAYTTFIKTWLKRKRIKHKVVFDGPVRRDGKVAGRRLQASMAASKQDQKAGLTQRLDVVCADTTRAAEFFKPATFDLVVTDAPYGVQHRSRSPASGLARRPADLLTAAVPVWSSLLRPGGAVGNRLEHPGRAARGGGRHPDGGRAGAGRVAAVPAVPAPRRSGDHAGHRGRA